MKTDRRHPLETLNDRLPLKLRSNWPQTLPKRVSDDLRHLIFRQKQIQKFMKCSKILISRLPAEDSSDWPETWAKRVSDDPQHLIFRRRNKKNSDLFVDHMII